MKKIITIAFLLLLLPYKNVLADENTIINSLAEKMEYQSRYTAFCNMVRIETQSTRLKYRLEDIKPQGCRKITLEGVAYNNGFRYDKYTDTFYLSPIFIKLTQNYGKTKNIHNVYAR